jgi:RNA polymerase sigma factor (sigma-70 family)
MAHAQGASSSAAGRLRPPPFSRVLEEHRAPVYRFLLAAVGPNGADDCFQETFLAALRAYPDLRDARNLRGWILTIATRKALDHWRAERRRPIPTERLPDRPAREHLNGDPALWTSVRELPPMQRAALIHRYVLDLPYADVAAALGCSVDAARANAYEGRRALRSRISKEDR